MKKRTRGIAHGRFLSGTSVLSDDKPWLTKTQLSQTQMQKLNYVLMVYAKIKQSESWATWIHSETQRIESGALINYQQFMNSAVMEQGKIMHLEGGFTGSTLTVSKDAVAMISNA